MQTRTSKLLLGTLLAGATFALATPGNATQRRHDGGGGLHALVYALPEGTEKLPDFRQLSPVADFMLDDVDVPLRNYTEGFPGVHDRIEWFGLEIDGTFTVDHGGAYTFRLESDDGAKLFIDHEPVVENDGIHAVSSKSGVAHLAAGTHLIHVEYFQGPKYEIALRLFVARDGAPERLWSRHVTS